MHSKARFVSKYRNLHKLKFQSNQCVNSVKTVKSLICKSVQKSEFSCLAKKKRVVKVVSVTAKKSAIKNKHLYFANAEQKVYLQSIGRTLDAYLASSRSESECSKDEKDKEMIPGEVNNKRPLDIAQTCLEEPSL